MTDNYRNKMHITNTDAEHRISNIARRHVPVRTVEYISGSVQMPHGSVPTALSRVLLAALDLSRTTINRASAA